jgi:hypothetical protein
MGVSLSPIVRADHAHAVNAVRAAPGEDAFTTAWAFGLVEYVLALLQAERDEEDVVAGTVGDGDDPL